MPEAERKALEKPLLSSFEAVTDYLHARLAHELTEEFRVLFLDNKNRLIRDEKFGEGTVNQAPAYPREIVKRAIELQASAVILVHNHPTRSIRSRWSTHKHAETLANSGIFGIA